MSRIGSIVVCLFVAVSGYAADFTATPQTGSAPLSVDFSGTSSGSPSSWRYDFGDGTTSSLQSPTHVYYFPGLYAVSMDAVVSGVTETATKSNYINIPPCGNDGVKDNSVVTAFSTVASGYAGASETDTIFLQSRHFRETLNANLAKTVTLTGGCDCTNSPAGGLSGLDGLVITDGTIISDGIVLQTFRNTAPVASAAEPITLPGNKSADITLSCLDYESDTITYFLSAPGHGTLSFSDTGLTYTPDPGYIGADSFQYECSDGTLTGNAVTISLTVTAYLQSIAVVPSNGANGNINNGYSQQFIATGTWSDSTTQDITNQVAWESSDTSKATINSTGLASSLSEGTTTFKATSGTVSGTSNLTVNPAFNHCTALASCTDTDGDGFCDSWEDADYIDYNGNGVYDADDDFEFPHHTRHLFSSVTRSGTTGTGTARPTVTDPLMPITPDPASIVVTITTSGYLTGNVVNAPCSPACPVGAFTYSINGTTGGPETLAPVVDLPGNLRLAFAVLIPDPSNPTGPVGPSFVAGETYSFTASIGPNVKVADKNMPNVYVQYDYMGTPASSNASCGTNDDCINAGHKDETCDAGTCRRAAGPSCSSDIDCRNLGTAGSPTHPNDRCISNRCTHDHKPIDPLLRDVVEAFENHGITLYIDPVHNEVPHAQVVTFSKPGDGTLGATAGCAGADVLAGNINRYAVNFHDIKNRTNLGGPFDAKRKTVFHYTVFSHYNTCDDPTYPGACVSVCPTDRSTPQGNTYFGSPGTSELPGNDLIISLGDLLYGSWPIDRTLMPLVEQSLFMHELGHNLGLYHSGGSYAEPDYKPNYMSIMNNNYIYTGIMSASSAGSNIPGSVRLDYSNSTLPVALHENSLDESAGVSPAGSGNKDIVFYHDYYGNLLLGAGEGPIDWNGNGAIDVSPVTVDLNGFNGSADVHAGYTDWVHGACATSASCPVSELLSIINGVSTNEPCANNSCQSLLWSFQCTSWGQAD